MIGELTVRVYGFLINAEKGLLVSDEYIRGGFYTKLPGGGLELGEGTKDCLKREFMEEVGIEVSVGEHIYTTDYFQPSAFKKGQQFMGIYYFVHTENTSQIKTHTKSFDFDPSQIKNPNGEAESFRWIPLSELSEDLFPLPTDKIAVRIVLKELQKK
ncbi:MAG: NUDIX hydrolase [Pseudopedobacter saltans]|uniref:NUDIX hydrolase n=1 Tax=Pseudopedobacter saltans TaxID=151895 RepID=A0A2W5EHW9_9SPHI|nr:MAG: NUDIX hydrolase [Pseudopedobacter saltans]